MGGGGGGGGIQKAPSKFCLRISIVHAIDFYSAWSKDKRNVKKTSYILIPTVFWGSV